LWIFPATPPPGPFRREFWRSPLRGPWLTSILGSLLLAGVTVVALTGFASHAAYNPDLGRNALIDPGLDLPLLTFDWPTQPAWLFGLSQGLHVIVGLAVVPLLLAKLWSVIPRLFAWPPAVSPAQAIERGAVALLVSSTIFQFATGILNAQYWYAFGFNFVVAHYYGGVVFIAALLVHLVVKMPVVVRAYRDRGVLAPAAGGPRAHAPRATRRGRTGGGGAGCADDLPARPARLRRRGLDRDPDHRRRAVGGRAAAPAGGARAARRGPGRRRGVPDQQDGSQRRRHARHDRRRLPARAGCRRP